MKMRHDVDATTIKRRKLAIVATALTVFTAAGAASPAIHVGALKTRHDGGGCCMRSAHLKVS